MMLRRPINENKLPAEITWTFRLVQVVGMLVGERLLWLLYMNIMLKRNQM